MADLSRFVMTVEFDTSKVGTGEDPINIVGPFQPGTKNLRLPQGISMIIFELVTLPLENDPAAQFPTYPIEWFQWNDDHTATFPVVQPTCFEVQFYNEGRCTVLAYNSVLHPINNEHPFNVVVAYKNKTYGSDPTIINEPPVG